MIENIGILSIEYIDINFRENGNGTCNHEGYYDLSNILNYTLIITGKTQFEEFFLTYVWMDTGATITYLNGNELIISYTDYEKLLAKLNTYKKTLIEIGVYEIIKNPNNIIPEYIFEPYTKQHKILYKIKIFDKELFENFFIKDVWKNRIKSVKYMNIDELIISKEEMDRLLMISKTLGRIDNIQNL